MTLRIEKSCEANTTALRLMGRVRAEHLDELNRLIENNEPDITLDLSEVNLVDIDVVRFLGACQAKGVRLTGRSPYIRTGSPWSLNANIDFPVMFHAEISANAENEAFPPDHDVHCSTTCIWQRRCTCSVRNQQKEEKQCRRHWKERLHSLRAARAALALQ